MTLSKNSSSFTSAKRGDALPPPPPAEICKALGISEVTIDWLAGDGSDRCYYRVMDPVAQQSYVLMQLSGQDAKDLLANGYEWIKLGEILDLSGIFVPKTIAKLPAFAAIIIEDYGNVMLESMIHTAIKNNQDKDIEAAYDKSFTILRKFLKIPADDQAIWCKRSFDKDRFEWELDFFIKEYLENVLQIKLGVEDRNAFDRDKAALSEFISSHSDYFVHRDFHSRNIMVKDKALAVIDFQDARLGPAAYDLVSLCFDSYVPFNISRRVSLLERGIGSISKDNQLLATELQGHWKPTLLQRQLKAIGSFGYLSVRKNRGNYLNYVKPALTTLDYDLVFDQRWPFISATLIEMIEDHIK